MKSQVLAAACAVAVAGCAPRLSPLGGTPAPVALPHSQLAPGRHLVVFQWEYQDVDFSSRGEGAARIASPDSVRMDFFLAGGLASGAAILIGNELRLPSRGDEIARRLVPPPPLLWATMGRVAIPSLPDTAVRVDGDTLRADIGKPVAWRLTFARDTLRRIERVDDGRVAELVERSADGRVRYRNQASRRQLDLIVTRTSQASAFDPAIWIIP